MWVGTLRESRDWFPAGLYMPFGCPRHLIRSSNRENAGNRGTCRSWPECRCIRAAGGNGICFCKTNSALQVPCFSPNGFLTHGQDFEMAYTAPPETSLPSLSAGRIKAEDKILPRRVDLRLRRICDVWTDF